MDAEKDIPDLLTALPMLVREQEREYLCQEDHRTVSPRSVPPNCSPSARKDEVTVKDLCSEPP